MLLFYKGLLVKDRGFPIQTSFVFSEQPTEKSLPIGEAINKVSFLLKEAAKP